MCVTELLAVLRCVGRTVRVQQVSVNTTQRIPFSGLHIALLMAEAPERTKQKEGGIKRWNERNWYETNMKTQARNWRRFKLWICVGKWWLFDGWKQTNYLRLTSAPRTPNAFNSCLSLLTIPSNSVLPPLRITLLYKLFLVSSSQAETALLIIWWIPSFSENPNVPGWNSSSVHRNL